MKSLYINQENGDTEFDSQHNAKEILDKKELKQSIWIRIKTNRGEWPFNTNFGFPWIELLSKKSSVNDYKKALIDTLRQENRIKKIEEITIRKNDQRERSLYIYFKVKTTEGLIKSSREVDL